MGGLFDALGMGGQALISEQRAAQITGSNIGNANVAGYHREDVDMTSASAFRGIKRTDLVRASNHLLEQQVNLQSGNLAYADNLTQGLTAMVGYVGDMSSSGLASALNSFFIGWRNLTVNPNDTGVRADSLGRAQALVARINRMGESLREGQSQADRQIQPILDAANTQIRQVAKLNATIVATQASGAPAADLQDNRDRCVAELANLIGATSTQESNGSISVYMGGVAVVSEDAANVLGTLVDATSGFQHITVTGTTQGNLDNRIDSGVLGAQLRLRDGELTAAAAQLDQFTVDLANAVNAQHQIGYGLDGVTGRNLFTAPTAVLGAAADLSLDASVANTPVALAAAQSTSAADNRAAVLIAGLSSTLSATSGTQTFGQSVASLIGGVGETLSQAQFAQTQAQTYLNQSQVLWQQSNGVNVQEQMVQLSRYQTSFQAATKLISVVEDMMQSLQNM